MFNKEQIDAQGGVNRLYEAAESWRWVKWIDVVLSRRTQTYRRIN